MQRGVGINERNSEGIDGLLGTPEDRKKCTDPRLNAVHPWTAVVEIPSIEALSLPRVVAPLPTYSPGARAASKVLDAGDTPPGYPYTTPNRLRSFTSAGASLRRDCHTVVR